MEPIAALSINWDYVPGYIYAKRKAFSRHVIEGWGSELVPRELGYNPGCGFRQNDISKELSSGLVTEQMQ